jgi:hypothetical protein
MLDIGIGTFIKHLANALAGTILVPTAIPEKYALYYARNGAGEMPPE